MTARPSFDVTYHRWDGSEIGVLSTMEQAAIDYVTALDRNEAAEPCDWNLRANELADALVSLRTAVGGYQKENETP